MNKLCLFINNFYILMIKGKVKDFSISISILCIYLFSVFASVIQ